MKIERLLTDEAILEELGSRLAQRRLELQLTQADLAEQAGVSKRTVERVEAGATTQMSTMIRVLRMLELLDRLEGLVPETGPTPLDLLKLKGKERKRASRKKKHKDAGANEAAKESSNKSANKHTWKWGDES